MDKDLIKQLEAEYKLIQEKKSELTYSNRMKVVNMYNYLKSKGEIK